MRATACIVACSPTTGSVFVLRRGLGSYHSQASLDFGRRKPFNATHGTATAMQLSFDLFLCFGSIAWCSSRLVGHAFVGATAGVRCAMVCIRGRGCCSRSPPVEVHDVSPRLWSSIVPKQQS